MSILCNKTTFRALSCIVLLFLSCKKSDKPTQPPEIYSINPTHGAYQTKDTIHGSGFDAANFHNTVYFNGQEATITGFNATELIVTVPKLAGTGPVSVSVSGRTGQGPIFTYDTTLIVTTFAGSGRAGYADGPDSLASFSGPYGLAVDTGGNLYVADAGNRCIRKITPDGTVTTFAGSPATIDMVDGQGTTARFQSVGELAMDDTGNIYVMDPADYAIRKISPTGYVSTIFRTPQPEPFYGSANIAGIAVDAPGNIYYGDDLHNQVIKVSPAGVSSIFAGGGGMIFGDGTGTSASFSSPDGMAFGPNGDLYVTDDGNNAIRVVTPAGVVTTLAGDIEAGFLNGPGPYAKFFFPQNIALDKRGNVYVNDYNNRVIRKISTSDIVSTYSYGGTGTGANGLFGSIGSLAIDAAGNIYVTDLAYNIIRKVSIQ
jgi:streptogramin lyase